MMEVELHVIVTNGIISCQEAVGWWVGGNLHTDQKALSGGAIPLQESLA
jgi:hypothetical protein